jgi:hypothetical protein
METWKIDKLALLNKRLQRALAKDTAARNIYEAVKSLGPSEAQLAGKLVVAAMADVGNIMEEIQKLGSGA